MGNKGPGQTRLQQSFEIEELVCSSLVLALAQEWPILSGQSTQRQVHSLR